MSKSKLLKLFPDDYRINPLPKLIDSIFNRLDKKVRQNDSRVRGDFNPKTYKFLNRKYSDVPLNQQDATTVVAEIADNFFSGIPRWRSPYLQYTVGAAVNVAASAIYAASLDENIFNINSGLAGNVLAAEQAVSSILTKLAKVETEAYGLFTFGGTATNLYGIKVGTRKAAPLSGRTGISSMKLIVTEDARFSHAVSADWLGLGVENVVTIKANPDRTSDLSDAEEKISRILSSGNFLVPTIILNGGTTYGHVVDDIKGFVDLRDTLVKRFKLSYKPHIHVDSVIGWAWLVYSGYDFKNNPLKINEEVLKVIHKQYIRIKNIHFADSWGVDFHKGVGACPVDGSISMSNRKEDLIPLSKSANTSTETHQLAQEFSFSNPSDYTLETSRSGGAPLAALAAFHTMGINGYRFNLASLIEFTLVFKKLLSGKKDTLVLNNDSLGYVTMVRLYPPKYDKAETIKVETGSTTTTIRDLSDRISKYNKAFFEWDSAQMGGRRLHECSFTSSYMVTGSGAKLSCLKFYPTSPHVTTSMSLEIFNSLVRSKKLFDQRVWAE